MSRRNLTIPGALLLIALALGLVFWSNATPVTPLQAQTNGTESVERMVQVTGSGRVSAVPDMAVVQLGVTTQAETAEEALGQNSVAMSDVISVTVETGVESEDIQTRGIRLQPIYDRSEEGQQTLTGYEASNVVEVTIRDLDSLGTILDAAIGAGGNTIQNIRFEVSDNEELLAAAREAAMNNAIQKAEQLVGLAGAELGEVLTINEVGATVPTPVELESADVASSAVPISPGAQTIEAHVQVSWRIR